jgi:hypothetical protein
MALSQDELKQQLKDMLTKYSNLSEEQKQRIDKALEIMRKQETEDDLKVVEYEAYKQEGTIQEMPIMSSFESGEMVNMMLDPSSEHKFANLTTTERSAQLKWDVLQAMQIYPKDIPLTPIHRKLSCSDKHMLIDKLVDIAVGNQQRKAPTGLFEALSMKRKQEEEKPVPPQQ